MASDVLSGDGQEAPTLEDTGQGGVLDLRVGDRLEQLTLLRLGEPAQQRPELADAATMGDGCPGLLGQ